MCTVTSFSLSVKGDINEESAEPNDRKVRTLFQDCLKMLMVSYITCCRAPKEPYESFSFSVCVESSTAVAAKRANQTINWSDLKYYIHIQSLLFFCAIELHYYQKLLKTKQPCQPHFESHIQKIMHYFQHIDKNIKSKIRASSTMFNFRLISR